MNIKKFIKEHKKEVILVGTTAAIVYTISVTKICVSQHKVIKGFIGSTYNNMEAIDCLSGTLYDVVKGKTVIPEDKAKYLVDICAEAEDLKLYLRKHYPKCVPEIPVI